MLGRLVSVRFAAEREGKALTQPDDEWVETDPEEDARQREAADKLNKWSDDQAKKKGND